MREAKGHKTMYSPPAECSKWTSHLLMLLDEIHRSRPDTRRDLRKARIKATYDITDSLSLDSIHTVPAAYLKPQGLNLKTKVFDGYV